MSETEISRELNTSNQKPQINDLNAALGRLQGLATKVSAFQSNFEEQYNSQRIVHEGKLQVIRDAISHIDRTIQRESSARVETLTATNASLEENLSEVSQTLLTRIEDIGIKTNERLKQLRDRIAVLQSRLADEVEKRKADFAALSAEAAATAAQLRGKLDSVATERTNEYDQIHTAAQTDYTRLADAIEVRAAACRSQLASLRDAIELQQVARDRVIVETKAEMHEIITKLNEDLTNEIKARMVSDTNFVKVIDEVTAEMEMSLKVVLNALG